MVIYIIYSLFIGIFIMIMASVLVDGCGLDKMIENKVKKLVGIFYLVFLLILGIFILSALNFWICIALLCVYFITEYFSIYQVIPKNNKLAFLITVMTPTVYFIPIYCLITLLFH